MIRRLLVKPAMMTDTIVPEPLPVIPSIVEESV